MTRMDANAALLVAVRFPSHAKGPGRERPRPYTGGDSSDARSSLQRPSDWFRRMTAHVMRDLRHEAAAAAPELAAWIDYLDIDGKQPKTLYTYAREIALLLREHPDTPFEQFTSAQVMSVLALKPARSRYITRSILNGWFEWGMQQDKIERSPMRKVPKGKQPRRRPGDIYTEGEIALLEALPSPDGPLCVLMFSTGMRKAGMRNLRRRDIDADRARLVVTEKGDKTRAIPFPPGSAALQAVADLDLLERLNPDDYLWYSRPGGGHRIARRDPISNTTFDRWWCRVLREAGVRYLNVHQTRHTYARRLRERRVTLETRRVLLGHDKISTTEDQYGREDVEDAAAVLAELW